MSLDENLCNNVAVATLHCSVILEKLFFLRGRDAFNRGCKAAYQGVSRLIPFL